MLLPSLQSLASAPSSLISAAQFIAKPLLPLVNTYIIIDLLSQMVSQTKYSIKPKSHTYDFSNNTSDEIFSRSHEIAGQVIMCLNVELDSPSGYTKVSQPTP